MRVKLGEVCKVVSGTTPKSSCPEYWNGTLNWVTPAELKDDSDIVYETERKITLRAVQDTGLKPFSIGTVLLSSRAPIGKVAIAGTEMYCNQGFKNLVCSGSIYNRYLYHFLKDKTEYLNALGRGATFKEISKDIVENIEIPLPPLETQRHIAAVLDKVSDLIAKRRKQLDKLDEMVKARFVEMFGDPVDNPMGWEKKPIVEICEKILSGGTPSKDHEEYFKGDIPWVSPKDMKTLVINDSQDHITEDAVQNSSTKIVPENSVLMVIRSGILKHTLPVAINTVPVAINQDMKAFVIQNTTIRPEYLLYYFKQVAPDILHGVRGVTADNIDFKTFQRRVIIVPSVKLQNQFAAFVTQTEKNKAVVQQALEKLETLKKALMQEYFG